MAPRKFEKLAVPKTAFETVGFFWAPLERRKRVDRNRFSCLKLSRVARAGKKKKETLVIVANICTPRENFNTVEWIMNGEKEIKIVSLQARAPRFAYK